MMGMAPVGMSAIGLGAMGLQAPTMGMASMGMTHSMAPAMGVTHMGGMTPVTMGAVNYMPVNGGAVQGAQAPPGATTMSMHVMPVAAGTGVYQPTYMPYMQ